MAATANLSREAQPTKVRRLSRSRFSTGHIVMVIAGVLGVALTVGALRADDGGTDVAVATHEIRAGEVIGRNDFTVDRIRASGDLLSTIVGGRASKSLPGEIAVETISENAVIPRGAVRPRAAGAGLRAMSIPLDPSLAVGGRLTAGDRVDVLFAGRASVSIIVNDAKVLAVDERGRAGIGESTSPFTLTIAVDAGESLLVAAAIADGNISVARTTGSAPSPATAPESLVRSTSTTTTRP